MNVTLILLTIILILAFLFIVTVISSIIIVNLFKEKKYKKAFNDGVASANLNYKPLLKAEELQQIIFTTAKYQFDKRKALVYDLNSMTFYKIEEELALLSNETRSIFSESFVRDFEFYYRKSYLDRYIVSIIEVFLIDDLKKRRPR